jgi:hypothetical protein
MVGWDDVPHLSEAEKARLLAATPPYLRDARSKGIPRIGAGAIYPVALDEAVCDDFALPGHWPRGYGLDVGWRSTAAAWGAWDRDNDIIYCFREYKRGEAEPAVHTAAIKAPGAELMGAIDPASRGRSQVDGKTLMREYEDCGLRLAKAKNAVEAGLFEVYNRLTTGRLKIFRSLTMMQAELRLYRRDDHGRVVKENDHLMDALRYLVATREDVLVWLPETRPAHRKGRQAGEGSWMSI